MINVWRQIETLPDGHVNFLGAESLKKAQKTSGVILRRSCVLTQHPFEQLVDGKWHAAFIRPKYWKRIEQAE